MNMVWVPGLHSTAARCSAHGMAGRGFRISQITAIPDAAQHEMLRRWSGTHRFVRIVDPVSAQHRYALQCAREGG